MTEQQVLQLINQFIIANGNNEITANVLRPILEEMLRQPNDKIGELANLSTEDKTNIVAAINEVLNTYTSGFTIHAGGDNPNTNPPGSYSIGDWYIRDGQFLYQYNGQNWNPITSIFTGDGNGVLMDDGSSQNVDYFRGITEWAPDVDIDERGLNGVFRIYQGSVYKLSNEVDLPYNTGSEFEPEDWAVVVQSGINFSNTPITPVLTFEEKQIRQGVLNGEYQIDAFGAVPGSFVVDYITADGVTTPEFGSGINVVQDNYINEEGALNRIFFEFVEGGTVNAYIGEGTSVLKSTLQTIDLGDIFEDTIEDAFNEYTHPSDTEEFPVTIAPTGYTEIRAIQNAVEKRWLFIGDSGVYDSQVLAGEGDFLEIGSGGSDYELTAQKITDALTYTPLQGAKTSDGEDVPVVARHLILPEMGSSPYYKATPTGSASGVQIVVGSEVNSITPKEGNAGNANTILGGGTLGMPNLIVNGEYRTIVGGYDNVISADGIGADTISGGAHHRITGTATHGTISGGSYNEISGGDYGTIGGGTRNVVSKNLGTTAGGSNNVNQGENSFIGSGAGNVITGDRAAIVTGSGNEVHSNTSVILAGVRNTIKNSTSAQIGCGYENEISPDGTRNSAYSVINQGYQNKIGVSATSQYSGVMSGRNNVINGSYSGILSGRENVISEDYSTATGRQANARWSGSNVHANGNFSQPGDAQIGQIIMRAITSNETPVELFLDGVGKRLGIPNNSLLTFKAKVVALASDNSEKAGWTIEGVIFKETSNASTVFISDPVITELANTGNADVIIDAFGNGTLRIRGVGISGKEIKFVATVEWVSVSNS